VSSQKGLALSGLAGAILAVSLIFLAAITGSASVIRLNTGNNSITTSTSPGSQTTGVQGPYSGTLSLLMTDPPNAPKGVTAVYVSYSSLMVHDEGIKWIDLNSSGSVELMGTVNVALTLSSAKVPFGTYDAIRFDISSATVTYQGKNYSATVQGGTLTIGIKGGEVVSGSHASAAIIDIRPSVVNIGSQTGPEFVLRPVAFAFSVPSGNVDQSMGREGNRYSLVGMQWWDDDRAFANATLSITSAALSSNSLSVSLKDNGSQDIQVRMVIITAATLIPVDYGNHEMPMALMGSAVFIVFPNGTLVQYAPTLHTMMPGDSQPSFLQDLVLGGLNLTAGSTTTLHYSGNITLGFGGMMTFSHSIASGQSYWVTVIGDQSVVSAEVTAS